MKEAHEAALKRQGAMDALKELQQYLLHCGCHPELKAEVNGIVWSLNAIKRRLDDLEVTPNTLRTSLRKKVPHELLHQKQNRRRAKTPVYRRKQPRPTL
jgi:hypothetical protein